MALEKTINEVVEEAFECSIYLDIASLLLLLQGGRGRLHDDEQREEKETLQFLGASSGSARHNRDKRMGFFYSLLRRKRSNL